MSGYRQRSFDVFRVLRHAAILHLSARVATRTCRCQVALTDSPRIRDTYAISVAREEDGRGGSRSLVDDTRVGDEIQISDPSNAFPLEDADDYLLIAGGISITPIRAMLHELHAAGHQRVRLLYLSRDAVDTAYLQELGDPELSAAIVLHQSRDSGRLDLWPYLAEPGDTHIYCCGSDALMNEVKALTFHWNPSALHFEDFARVSATQIGDASFTAIWTPTAQRIVVDAGTSFLDALRANEIIVDSSCNSGTCGTCRVSLLKGTAEHRDLVLRPDEQADFVMPCVSRADKDVTLEVGPVQ